MSAIKPVIDAVRALRAAYRVKKEAERELAMAWARLGEATSAATGTDAENALALNKAERMITDHMTAEREERHFL